MKQNTLAKEISVRGIGVNSGLPVTLTLKPAAAGAGIVFRRVDLPDRPEGPADVFAVTDLVRKTALAVGNSEVRLVEHVLSALHGCGADNVTVEMDAAEAPIMDGSAKAFVEMIQRAGLKQQDAEREYFRVDSPIQVTRGATTLVALPAEEFRVTYTALDDRIVEHAQHLSLVVTPEVYVSEIAPARTYVVYEDAEAMKKAGGIRGGSLENCIVVRGREIMCAEPLRFADEFVRHKILDIVGDIALLGRPIRAHLIAMRAGHALHAELTKALLERARAATRTTA